VSEHDRLASAWEDGETKVKAVETNLSTAAGKLDAGLASLAFTQRKRQGHVIGLGNSEVVTDWLRHLVHVV